MKKLMVLGAGYTQIPLLKAASRAGYHTICASIPGEYPGFSHADEICHVDISDPEAVLRAARVLSIDGIATCGLDLGMRAIGRVCEALRLPGPSREAAMRASNKLLMKQAFEKAGVQTAAFRCIRNAEDLREALKVIPLPAVIKAVDQMGSRGIFRCESAEEAQRLLPESLKASREDYCLIEEFIEGELFGAEGMIQNGKILFLLPDNTEAFVRGTASPVGHSLPFRYEEMLGEQVRTQVKKALFALGLDNCPFNCDLIRKGDRVYIVELTGRSGATGLSELVGLWYDIDYYEAVARLAAGEDVHRFFTKKEHTACLSTTLRSDREGIVEAVYAGAETDERTVDFSFNIGPGDTVRPYTNGRDRIGQIIVKGRDPEECTDLAGMLSESVVLKLAGDLPVIRTPVQRLRERYAGNTVYMKREDLHPFALGGNKVRFAMGYLKDMERKHATAMLMYGGYPSNLCRILAAACAQRNIPCAMVYNENDDHGGNGFNKELIRIFHVIPYPCRPDTIRETVLEAMEAFRRKGEVPYYIHGNEFGKGNVWVPMHECREIYREIRMQEKALSVHFDRIFLAGSTNTTQAGLVAEELRTGESPRTVGISVNRKEERAREVILSDLCEYREHFGIRWKGRPEAYINVTDDALCGGYGCVSEELMELIRRIYLAEGICLDPVYTGKGFLGMTDYLEKHHITDQNILFLHTGGLPAFFELMEKGRLFGKEE